MKVKDIVFYWQKIIFHDRTILRDDLKYMSADQIEALDNLTVIKTQDRGTTLFVE